MIMRSAEPGCARSNASRAAGGGSGPVQCADNIRLLGVGATGGLVFTGVVLVCFGLIRTRQALCGGAEGVTYAHALPTQRGRGQTLFYRRNGPCSVQHGEVTVAKCCCFHNAYCDRFYQKTFSDHVNPVYTRPACDLRGGAPVLSRAQGVPRDCQ